MNNENSFTGIFQQRGIIKNGDRIQSISQKYRDINKKEPLGPTYMEYTILESKPLGDNKFYTKGFAFHELEFNYIKKGTVYVQGLSERIATLDGDGNISKLEVVKSEFIVLGGTGDFEHCKGNYMIKNIENFYKGLLTCYYNKNNMNSKILYLIYIILVCFLMFYIYKI